MIDLITAVDKLNHEHPLYNEMQIKKEKMQAELLVVEDELFELSKRQSAEVDAIIQEQESMENESRDHTNQDIDGQSSPTESAGEQDLDEKPTEREQPSSEQDPPIFEIPTYDAPVIEDNQRPLEQEDAPYEAP